jgi:hypothetical protein
MRDLQVRAPTDARVLLMLARVLNEQGSPYFDRIRDEPRFVKKLEGEGILAQHREAWMQHLAWQRKTGGQTP